MQLRRTVSNEYVSIDISCGIIFFIGPYQSTIFHVSAGLLMKKGRFLINEGLGSIINPAGHYASQKDYL